MFSFALDAYQNETCPYRAPAPYTGNLMLDSRYDESTSAAAAADDGRIKQYIDSYQMYLARFADYYMNDPSSDIGITALACLDQWTQLWAAADALTTTEATDTGVAVRKWALASVASTLWKANRLSGNQFLIEDTQARWLTRLADIVIAEHTPRLDPGYPYFNNHDYWAAWAVTVTGQLLNRPDYLDWSEQVLQRALTQITPSELNARLAVLPNELARGALAARYTHYALIPLFLLYDAQVNYGRRYSEENRNRLQQLATFAAATILRPDYVAPLFSTQQQAVPDYYLVWLYPFLHQFPNHPYAKQLLQQKAGSIDGYSQVGGRIAPLYGF